MNIRLAPSISPTGKGLGRYAERCCLRPAMALHRISCRDGSRGVEPVKILGIGWQWRRCCVHHLFRRPILSSLEIRIEQVIFRVQLVPGCIVFPGRRFRSKVGFDRLLPKAQAGKNMRRHMQCMRRVRRDLGIAACCIEGPTGKRRIVVGMDNVMSYPGMIWLLGKNLFQNRTGLLLIRISLISG